MELDYIFLNYTDIPFGRGFLGSANSQSNKLICAKMWRWQWPVQGRRMPQPQCWLGPMGTGDLNVNEHIHVPFLVNCKPLGEELDLQSEKIWELLS